MRIRPATRSDLVAINAIYNPYVLTSPCTLQLEPSTLPEREQWFLERSELYPATVAERDGQIVGWGSLSPFHARSGYRGSVENSVYVASAEHGKGIGSALLADLIERAQRVGHHCIIARITATAGASLALHHRHGFVAAGTLREVGFKLGAYVDVAFLQKLLAGDPFSGDAPSR